ncbi:MAG: hypothetical protein U5L11_16365 [Arhodomonas sp.]|nr:hypothetical protein [Arhodomonas sp.]
MKGEDEPTRRLFGEYISTYDFQRAVQDNATVPLYYDARGEKLGVATEDINERIAERLERFEAELDDMDVAQRLERELKRDYHVITADERLKQVADDFVEHYTASWETGKAMFVCIDKLTCGAHVRAGSAAVGREDRRAGERVVQDGRRAGGPVPASADRLDARDADGRGGQRGAG